MAEQVTSSRVPGLPHRDRALVMGIVNVTPDSFSDGGQWQLPRQAVRHGLDLVEGGADLIDVGGESTRPGAVRVDEEEELRRVVPVVTELSRAGAAVSIDTMRAAVARAALEAGASMVNDVSGGLADPRMSNLIADAGSGYVLMHWRGHSIDMQSRARYGDVVREVTGELERRVDAVVACGVRPEQVVLDPGLGFAKSSAHDWALLAGLEEVRRLGRPVLVGASRKKFLGRLLADRDETPRGVTDRDDASLAVATLAAASGAWGVRSHLVRPAADAVRVAAAWRDAQRDPTLSPLSSGG